MLQSSFKLLPVENVREICSKLTHTDILRICLVETHFLTVIFDDKWWLNLFNKPSLQARLFLKSQDGIGSIWDVYNENCYRCNCNRYYNPCPKSNVSYCNVRNGCYLRNNYNSHNSDYASYNTNIENNSDSCDIEDDSSCQSMKSNCDEKSCCGDYC